MNKPKPPPNSLTEPRAIAAYYEPSDRTITVRLRSGASFSFPVDIVQGLVGAETQDLKQVEINPMGDGLHWETLDTDFLRSQDCLQVDLALKNGWQNYNKNGSKPLVKPNVQL